MDFIIEFFRDTLVGPFYIVWVVVCVILIFACIGYLAEKVINIKKEKEKYVTVDDNNTSLDNQVVGAITNNNNNLSNNSNNDVLLSTNLSGDIPIQKTSVVSPVSEVHVGSIPKVSSVNDIVTGVPEVIASNDSAKSDAQVIIPSITQNENDNTI